MASELAAVVGLHPAPSSGDEPELRQAADRLRESGYALRAEIDFAAMATQRSHHQGCVDALAEHLGKPRATLVRQI